MSQTRDADVQPSSTESGRTFHAAPQASGEFMLERVQNSDALIGAALTGDGQLVVRDVQRMQDGEVVLPSKERIQLADLRVALEWMNRQPSGRALLGPR